MYIDKESLNSKDFKKIEETFNDNLYSNDLINFALEERFSINKNRIEEFMKENKVNSNDAIKNMYFELFELENDEYTLNKLNEYEILNFKELSINDYLNDPYYKDIKIKEIYKNGYHLYYRKYIPYEIFLYKDITLKSKYYEEINHIGYFNDYFSFLSLNKDDVTWMSITPHEINTMKDYIKEMKGKCLIYGLGLGYFPYLISLKKM